MQLSPHFTLAEMTASGTADSLGIDNEPDTKQRCALRVLCVAVLDPLRAVVGPLQVTSGFRSAAVNEAVGSSSRSQHPKGQAGDVIPLNTSRDDAFLQAIKLIEAGFPIDQLITYEGKPHMHISCTHEREPRGQILVSTGSSYIPWDEYQGPLK